MNKYTFEANWNKIRGTIKEQWGNLTDDDLDMINGKYDKLVGRIQEKYSVSESTARKMIEDWNLKEKVTSKLDI